MSHYFNDIYQYVITIFIIFTVKIFYQFQKISQTKQQTKTSQIVPQFELLTAQKTSRVKALAFSQQNSLLCLSTLSGHIILYDYLLNVEVARFLAHNSPVRALALHSTLPLLVTGGDDKLVKLWDITVPQQAKLIHTFVGHKDFIRSISFANIQPYIASASDDFTIKIFNFQIGHRDFVMSLAFDQTDSYLASCSLDKTVKVFSIQQCVEKHKQSQQNKGIMQTIQNAILTPSISPFCSTTTVGSPLNSICWSATTKNILYSADDAGTLRTYKLTIGKNLQDSMIYEVDSKQGPQNGSNYVLCTTDGITFGGNDGKVRIYDEQNRKELYKFDIMREINKKFTQNEFQVDTTRVWCLSQDAKNKIYGVGFDEGYAVYKVGHIDVAEHNGFMYKGGRLFQMTNTDDSKNNKKMNNNEKSMQKLELNEIFDCKAILEQYTKINQLCEPIDLICLGDPFPMLLGYKTSQSQIRYFVFLNSKREQKINEIISQCKLTQRNNEAIVSSLMNNKLVTYNINFGGLQIIEDYTFQQSEKVQKILYVQDDLLVQTQNKTYIVDKNWQIIKELSINQEIEKVLYCQQHIIYQTQNKLYIYNQNYELIDQVNSITQITSCIVSSFANSKENIILYSNNTHICYYHIQTQIQGCLTSVNQQIFLYQSKDNIISFFTNEGTLLQSSFDSTITDLIIKAAEHKVGDVYQLERKLKKQKFTPISVCKRLLDAQEPNAALQMLSDKNFQNVKNYIQIKQHMPVEYKEGLDKKQVQINSILSLQTKELIKSSDCLEQATLNALFQSNQEVQYDQANTNEQLMAAMINHDNQQLINILLKNKMYGAALALCQNYNLNEEQVKQQIPQKQIKLIKIEKGKQLQFKQRQNKIENWKFTGEVEGEPEDVLDVEPEQENQVQQEQQQQVTKQWNSDESSSESTQQQQNEDIKQQNNNGFDESSTSSSEEPELFDIDSQAMKQLGICKQSEFAEQMLQKYKGKQELDFTLSDVKHQLNQALQQFTNAEFNESKRSFQETLFNSKLLLATGQVTQKQIKSLIEKSIIYLKALTCEIYRREHEDITSEQQANLILGFASCTQNDLFETEHKQLVLKLMMHKIKKIDYRSAQIIAQELIKISTDQEVLQKAEKVLQKVGTDKIEQLPQFQSLKELQVDFSTMKVITQSQIQNLTSCSYCESLYSKQQMCVVCQYGQSD